MTLEHKNEIEAMSDKELVAFWNVLQFNRRMGNGEPDKAHAVSIELTRRKIPHEVGKRTVTKETGALTTVGETKKGEYIKLRNTDTYHG